MLFWYLLVCYVLLWSSYAFPPQVILNEYTTKSHNCITLMGIYRTSAEFLTRYNLVNSTGQSTTDLVREYFGTDSNSYFEFIRTISRIVQFENDIQITLGDVAFYHVHGEQINLAHNYLRSLRRMIQVQAKASTPSVDIIREKIGHALYTLQEFYSNTNWVEEHGVTVYEEFGQENATLVETALNDPQTCADCDTDTDGSYTCKNNIITKFLTSGYKSGQDIVKVIGKGIKKGKCSIGTSDDKSRNRRAKGGIYKGRSTKEGAPHYHLHTQAVEAAIKATVHFLMNEKNGIVNILGRELFQDVFHLKTRESVKHSSLTFVVDVSGSMGVYINAVVASLKTVVLNSRASEFVPAKYILVEFNDPESLTKGKETSDWIEMIQWLEIITVSGGGDCPEFALSGMMKGIQMSNKNSKLYLCTDASAKDSDKVYDVINGLAEKSLTPVFLLTGTCGLVRRQEKRDAFAHSESRNSGVFESIAEETGGSIYYTNSEEMGEIIIKEIEDTFPSSSVIVQWLELDPTESSTSTEITVDSTIKVLQIQVRGVAALSEISVQMPNGTDVPISELKDETVTVSIPNPDTGKWKLTNLSEKKWLINVTAQSQLDFDVVVLQTTNDGTSHKISGNPILGQNYTIAVDINNLPDNSTCDSVVLLSENGSVVSHLNVTGFKTENTWRFLAPFNNIRRSIYSVLIKGQHSLRNQYVRTRMYVVKPVAIKLTVKPFMRDLSWNVTDTVFYEVLNSGDARSIILVQASDDQGYILNQSVSVFYLESGGMGAGNFTIQATDFPGTVKLNVTVTDRDSNDLLQTYTKTYSVSDIQRPACTTVRTGSSECPPEARNTANCSLYSWNVISVLSFSGTKLSTVSVTNDEVKVVHDDIDGVEQGPIKVNLSGHCCFEKVVLSAIDEDGFHARCVHVLSDEPITEVNEETLDAAERNGNYDRIWIAVFSSMTSLCLIMIVLFVAVMFKKKYMYRKKYDVTAQQLNQRHNPAYVFSFSPSSTRPNGYSPN